MDYGYEYSGPYSDDYYRGEYNDAYDCAYGDPITIYKYKERKPKKQKPPPPPQQFTYQQSASVPAQAPVPQQVPLPAVQPRPYQQPAQVPQPPRMQPQPLQAPPPAYPAQQPQKQVPDYRDDRGYYSTEKRPRGLTCKWLLLILLLVVLLLAGLALGLYFGLGFGDEGVTPTATPGPVTTIRGRFTILDWEYVAGMGDPTSAEFMRYESAFTTTIHGIISTNLGPNYYADSRVLSFSPGSAIVDYSVDLRVEEMSSQRQAIMDQLHCGLSSVYNTDPISIFFYQGMGWRRHETCSVNSACQLSGTQYTCVCADDYILSADGFKCIYSPLPPPYDPCEPNPCEKTCLRDGNGYECECGMGYLLDDNGKDCHNIDECAIGEFTCEQNCVDTEGSYVCKCAQGYMLGADQSSCLDIDECEINLDACTQICINDDGRYECDCEDGYLLAEDDATCTDIDECADSPCEADPCLNTPGSYQCDCPSGFRADASATGCEEIDECAEGTDNCQQSCINSPAGSFTCDCDLPGFEPGADSDCEDIDECAGWPGCSDGCINTYGSYSCICPGLGYRLAIDDGKTCEDVDECSEGSAVCQELCTNTDGSYTCSCFDDTNYSALPDGTCVTGRLK